MLHQLAPSQTLTVRQTQQLHLFPLTATGNNKRLYKHLVPASMPVFLCRDPFAFDGRGARYKPWRHRKPNNVRATIFCDAAGLTCMSSWSWSSWTRAKTTSALHPTCYHRCHGRSWSSRARRTTDGARGCAHVDRRRAPNNGAHNNISAA